MLTIALLRSRPKAFILSKTKIAFAFALKSELRQFSPPGANLPNGFLKFVFPHVGMDIKAASNAF